MKSKLIGTLIGIPVILAGLLVYWVMTAPWADFNPCTDTIDKVLPNYKKTAAIFVTVRDCGATTRANPYMIMSDSEKGLQLRNDELVYTDTGHSIQDSDIIYRGLYETVEWTGRDSILITGVGTDASDGRLFKWKNIRIEYR